MSQIEEIKYEDFLKQVKTGDLFFTDEKNLVSFAIRKFTRSKISHTGGFYWDVNRNLKKNLFIHEASFGQKFSPMLASQRFRKEKHFYWGRLPREICKYTEEESLDRAKYLFGSKYDSLDAFFSLLMDIDKNEGVNNHEEDILFRDLDPVQERFFCSEVQAKIHGVKPLMSLRDITPADLANMCGNIKKVIL